MSEVLIPPWIIPEEEPQEPLDEGSSVFNAAFAPGLTQRQSYGGMRLKLSRRHTVRLEEKAQLLSALRSTRGRYNAVRSKVHFALRGSFPAAELLSNNTFADGTTGWTGQACSLSVLDRQLRLSLTGDHSVTAAAYRIGIAVPQYSPLVARCGVVLGRGITAAGVLMGSVNDASNTTSGGIATGSCVALGSTASMYVGVLIAPATYVAGDSIIVSYASLSRCALVDNGSNQLLQSDELDATWTTTRCGVDDQTAATVAPDGTSTADSIIEDSSASSTHFVNQDVAIGSGAADYFFGGAFKAGARTWVYLQLVENTASATANASFNLTTGVVGTANISGANWSNIRSFIVSLGNGWYYCGLVARKTNAATSLSARIYIGESDNDVTYSGNGTSNIYAWRATLAQSSVPTRLVQTTSALTTGTSQVGTGLYIKGLPASTTGLLLPEDIFEINGELKTCTAALNSDAAGLGYLQFEPALVRSPADNDPVIILDPMGKFLMSNLKIDNEFGTQAKVSYDLEHIYE